MEAGNIKQPDFKLEELDSVLSQLNNDKSTGPHQIPNEIFTNRWRKCNQYLLNVLNCVKNSQHISKQCQNMTITKIYKNKSKTRI